MHHVFVYGSLLSGLGNHRILDGSEFLGRGEALGEFEMRDLRGFPGAHRSDGGDVIHGELYAVDDETLARLDHLESNGRFYQREPVDVWLTDEDVIQAAEVYLLLQPHRYADAEIVEDNDWRPHVAAPTA